MAQKGWYGTLLNR